MTTDMKKLPVWLKKYFWDVRFDLLGPRRFGAFIVERILEYGDPPAVRWMQGHFRVKAILEVLRRSRALSTRSAYFWVMVYQWDRAEVLCLSRSFQRRRRRHWLG